MVCVAPTKAEEEDVFVAINNCRGAAFLPEKSQLYELDNGISGSSCFCPRLSA